MGRICRKGRFYAWSERVRGWKMIRMVSGWNQWENCQHECEYFSTPCKLCNHKHEHEYFSLACKCCRDCEWNTFLYMLYAVRMVVQQICCWVFWLRYIKYIAKGLSSHAMDLVVCVNPSSSSCCTPAWVWVGECFFRYPGSPGQRVVKRLCVRVIQSNPLKWLALGPGREYPHSQGPLVHVLYFTLCLNGTTQMISI